MHRGHTYTSWEDVQEELSNSIRNLAPSGLKNQRIPFLSLGSDVGKRETIFQGKSNLSGDYIVEEITGQDQKIFRRLIFLSNQFVIQSEALIKVGEYFFPMSYRWYIYFTFNFLFKFTARIRRL